MTILPLFALLAAAPAAAPAAQTTVSASMVAATSMGEALPFDAYEKGAWTPDPEARFVKLHLYADAPFPITGIVLENCEAFSDSRRPDFYINFDERKGALKGEGGSVQASFPVMQARSVTINFDNNKVCLKKLQLLDGAKNPIRIVTPRVVKGTVKASSTLDPASSYDVARLFDSKYEYAWASNHKKTGVTLTFDFADAQKIEKVKIWNGYQRSEKHCWSNSRPKAITLKGDGGYTAKIAVEDKMGPQEIALPAAFSGKHLEMTVTEAYAGKAYEDLVISELRFFDGSGWFLVDPLPALKKVVADNRASFEKAKVAPALDHSLKGSGGNLLRLRGDGSLYFEAEEYSAVHDGMAEKHTMLWGLGNYEIKKADAAGLTVRLFGYLRTRSETYEIGDDCNGCGRDCNAVGAGTSGELGSGSANADSDRIFQQEITLTKFEKGPGYSVAGSGTAKAVVNFGDGTFDVEK